MKFLRYWNPNGISKSLKDLTLPSGLWWGSPFFSLFFSPWLFFGLVLFLWFFYIEFCFKYFLTIAPPPRVTRNQEAFSNQNNNKMFTMGLHIFSNIQSTRVNYILQKSVQDLVVCVCCLQVGFLFPTTAWTSHWNFLARKFSS